MRNNETQNGVENMDEQKFQDLFEALQNNRCEDKALQAIYDAWYGFGYDGMDEPDARWYSMLEDRIADEAQMAGWSDS